MLKRNLTRNLNWECIVIKRLAIDEWFDGQTILNFLNIEINWSLISTIL